MAAASRRPGACPPVRTETVPLLGSIPLSVALREGGDAGLPIVLGSPEDPAAAAILSIAAQLATRSRSLAGRSLPVAVR